MSTKFPTSVMVMGVVSSDGDVMPPYFFPEGLRVAAKNQGLENRGQALHGWLEWPARGRMSFNKTLRQCIWPVRPMPDCTSNYPTTGRRTFGHPPALILTHLTIMSGAF